MNGDLPDKKSLRESCLALRAGVDEAQARAASQTIAALLMEFITHNQSIIAGYRAIRGELDIGEAMQKLAAKGHRLCLPVVDAPGAALSFRHWLPGQPLETGMHGTEVPMRQQFSLIPEVVLVPLVGFDKVGHRLGYGAGYYDRTIAILRAKKPIQIIGVGYSVQQVESIPADPHDQRLDAVVTEKGIMKL